MHPHRRDTSSTGPSAVSRWAGESKISVFHDELGNEKGGLIEALVHDSGHMVDVVRCDEDVIKRFSSTWASGKY